MKRKYSEIDESDKENIYRYKHHVYFYSDVTRSSCFQLIKCIEKCKNYIQKKSIKDSIYIHICSDGGDLLSSLAVVDYILNSETDIVTVCEGSVASAGVLISLAGKKRCITKHSYMLIHELRSFCYGKYTECQDDMKNNDILMKDMIKYIQQRCNHPYLQKNLKTILKQDILWNANKCLKYGLVTKII
jgi:ATP-dependent protease ClpP protease subunit